MASRAVAPTRRSTYHHGDLQRALVEAGLALARTGGPEAVALRAATRQVGVAANAAYRHFPDREGLLQAVCSAAQAEAARAMETELDAVPPASDPVTDARARLRAVGEGYLRFARSEPGLFRTAFSVPAELTRTASPESAGDRGLTPFQLLANALDEMVAAGVLAQARRPGAEFLAWSAVHGLAVLVTGGPLRTLDDAALRPLTDRLLDMVDAGLPQA